MQKQKQNTMSNLKLFYNADDINMLQRSNSAQEFNAMLIVVNIITKYQNIR